MNQDDLSFFYSWFSEYVQSYYSKDPYVQMNIKSREEHTYRVCKNIVMIGRDMRLDEEQLQIGETIALFHDIGRFEQFKTYQTFSDRQSQNHATLSVKRLQQTDLLKRVSEEEKSIITKAISSHNLYTLPVHETTRCLLYAKLLRDADKLDIWPEILEYESKRHRHPNPAIEQDFVDTQDYSKNFIERIMHSRCINVVETKTYTDMKLCMLSWIFDINFLPTFHYIYRHRYLDRLVESLPKTGDIKRVEEHVHAYLQNKLRKNNSEASTCYP
jgi:hypothetical protein